MKGQRKIKFIALLLSITSCLFMFGVGFSTWYNLSTSDVVTSTGSIEVYDVLTIQNSGMTLFKSSLFSFKTNDQTLSDSSVGVITVNYKVPVETLAATDGSFAVDLTLGYSELVIPDHRLFEVAFGNSFAGNTFSVDMQIGNSTTSMIANGKSDRLAADGTITVTKTFTADEVGDLNSDFEFTVIYTLNIEGGENFKESFGKYLRGTEGAVTTKFAASAQVRDVQ